MATPRSASGHTTRPQSSLSQRPVSRISSRPLSRVSGNRLVSKHTVRLGQLSHALVSQVAGLSLDGKPDKFSAAYEKTMRALEARYISSETIETIDVKIQRYTGLAESIGFRLTSL